MRLEKFVLLSVEKECVSNVIKSKEITVLIKSY